MGNQTRNIPFAVSADQSPASFASGIESGMTAPVTKEADSATNVSGHHAVWLDEKRAPFQIRPTRRAEPRSKEILVRNRAVAINPNDWLMQSIGGLAYPWLKYPFILGSDIAGEIVAVGVAVTRFKIGDRVLGHAVGADKSRNDPAEGAFQEYTILLDHMASPIPDSLTFEQAAVLPLALSTAACGLFQKDQLALNHPSADPEPSGKTLIVWGGSTSVGSNAIQLAVAAGYDVVTTASPKNFAYVKNLGARAVFDYRSPTAVADIIAWLKGRSIAGAIAIGLGSTDACLDIVDGCEGNKFVAQATPPISFEKAPLGHGRLRWLIPTMARMIAANLALMLKARRRGIGVKFIFGTTLIGNDVGKMIYGAFLPEALRQGRYVAAPEAFVFGQGLARIPAAIEAQKQGLSAQKLVVSL